MKCVKVDNTFLSSLSCLMVLVNITTALFDRLPILYLRDWVIALISCRLMECDGGVMGTTASLLRSSVPMIVDFALWDN